MPVSHRRRLFGTLLLGIFTLLAACSGGGSSALTTPTTPAVPSTKLVKAAGDADLEKRLKAELVKRYQRQEVRYYYGGLQAGRPLTPADTGAQTTTSGPQSLTGSSAAAAAPHSDTNVQESGVDEGDLVKTDGSFIYLARGSHFLVLSARPAEQTAVVSDLDLTDPISELYLANGRVTLFTAPYNYPVMATGVGTSMPAFSRPVTRLHLYDVSNPASPSLRAKYDFPGASQGSRRIGNTIYVVTNYTVDLPNPVTPWDYLAGGTYDMAAFNDASTKATAENLRRIEALTLDEMLPKYSRTLYSGGVAGPTTTVRAVASGDVSCPERGNGTDLSLVFALDTSTATPAVTSSAVLSSWCRIYMSPESLYLTSGNDWFWIEPVAGAALPPANPEPSTAVHKFAVGSGGKPVYRGSGVVSGWTNNQFSLGEYNGYLRIGTTRGGWWGEGISNQLAILCEQGGELVQTGRIERPGVRGENLRDAVRPGPGLHGDLPPDRPALHLRPERSEQSPGSGGNQGQRRCHLHPCHRSGQQPSPYRRAVCRRRRPRHRQQAPALRRRRSGFPAAPGAIRPGKRLVRCALRLPCLSLLRAAGTSHHSLLQRRRHNTDTRLRHSPQFRRHNIRLRRHRHPEPAA